MAEQKKVRRGTAGWKVIGVMAVTGVVAAGAWMVLGGSGERAVTSSADIATVSTSSFDITTIATGDLQARRQVEVRSGLGGRAQIVELVDEGVRVKAGDVLVRLNDEEIKREIQEETLRTEAARSELTSARNAVLIQQSENDSRLRQSKLSLELADLALKQWVEGDVKKRREELRIALEKAQRDYERLKEKAENSAELYLKNFKSKNDNELDQINAKEAAARLEIAKLDLAIYEDFIYPREERQKRSDVTEAEAEVERVTAQNESQLASKQADLAHRQRQFEIRETKLNELADQLENTTIRAPKDGLVVYWASTQGRRWDDSRGTLQVGREVHPRETLIVLPDTTEMIASVQVHESIAGRVRPGQPATVKIDALSDTVVHGTVEAVGVLAESGGWRDPNLREYNVRIGLRSDDDSLKPSMRCEAEIRLGRVEEALTIPVAAIFNQGNLHYVYRPRDGKFERVPVRVGRRSSTRAEILAGLAEGERVLAREPGATEVRAEPWDPAELEIAGYAIGPDGRPAPIGLLTAQSEAAAAATSHTPDPGERSDRPNRAGRRGPGAAAEPGEGAAVETSQSTDQATGQATVEAADTR